MAGVDDSIRLVHELIEQVAEDNLRPGVKSTIILRLAEAAAWLSNPNEAHGGSVEVSS